MIEIQHYIGGKLVGGSRTQSAPVFNPATGDQTAKVGLARTSEVNQAVARRFPP